MTDHLFYNGIIHTADAALPRASVLAVRQGRIAYVGNSRAKGAATLAPGFAATDLEGRVMVPGLADSHLHFIMLGLQMTELDLHLKSREDILACVAARAAITPPGQWVTGRGWSHEVWPDRQWPCKEDLDAICPHLPIALTRLDGHSLWVNSAALLAAGLNRESPEYPGGEILRRADGELTGILVDTPAFVVRSAMPPRTPEQLQKACLLAQAELFRHGVTSIGDAWQTPADHALLQTLYASGDLCLRIYGMLASRVQGGGFCTGPNRDPVVGAYADRLSLRAYKLVLDGSLGSRSAWLTEDYADRPGHSGSHRYTDEELLHVAGQAVARGFQLCLHAIGDAAVLQALRTLEALHQKNPEHWLPHRIEHFQIASPDTVARAMALGVIPAMQTLHALADKDMAVSRLKPTALARAYPWREVLDQGGIIPNGSDSPMDGDNPFLGFYAAVTREAFAGQGQKGPVAMTREEALLSYTLWPAMAEMAAAHKGSLSVGKYADCAVLDRDIMTCPVEELPQTRVCLTLLAGVLVYSEI